MAKMNWSWNEKASLKDAVKKFREKHGNVPLDWKSLTAKAQVRIALLKLKMLILICNISRIVNFS